MTIDQTRLATLDHLDRGSHLTRGDGMCFNEAAAWVANEAHTDAPACVSPVLRRYTIRLNDRWDYEQRQTLLPYLPRVIGTAGDGLDPARERIAANWAARRLLGPWLRLAGLDAEAAAVEAAAGDIAAVRQAIRVARDSAWRLRSERYSLIRAKVRERLGDKSVADAVAAAAAVADAAAAAAAAAAAVAAADAVAAAVADADAVAAAVAAADAGSDSTYSAAYKAARAYYDAHPLPVSQQIADLAAEQRPLELELLDALIRGDES